MRPLFTCYGGKFYQTKHIISFFPPDYQKLCYLEVFIGGGSILLNKEKSREEIINDINPGFVAAWKYIKNLNVEKRQRLWYSMHNVETFQQALSTLSNSKLDKSKDLGFNTLIVQRMSRAGLGKDYSKSERLRGNQPEGQNSWESWIESLPEYKKRLKNTKIENLDFAQLFDKYNITNSSSEQYQIYADPPYLHETRTSKNCYEYEMDRKSHVILAAYLLNTSAKVMISGYPSELYFQMYKDWNVVELEIVNHSGQNKKKQKRKELLWMNY